MSDGEIHRLKETGALDRARSRALDRLLALEPRLDDDTTWQAYLDAARTLAVLATDHAADALLLTTRQLAERIGCDERTVRRHKRAGLLRPAVEAGRVVRWRPDAASNGIRSGTALRMTAKSAAGSGPTRAVRP